MSFIDEGGFGACSGLRDIYYYGTEEEWNNIDISDVNSWLSSANKHYLGDSEHIHIPGDAKFENRIEPTCVATGSYDSIVYCDVCDEELSCISIESPATGHSGVYGTCPVCGFNYYSEGLEYTAIDDTTCYVSDIGTCTDTEVVIPSVAPDGRTVVRIGSSAFWGCTGLEIIVIPDSVTSIDSSAFRETEIEGFAVADNNTSYKSIDGNLYTKDGKILVQYATGKKDVSFTVPEGVEIIDWNAFYYCTALRSITIPESVTSIGEDAFSGCTNLTDVYYNGTEEEWNAITIDSYNTPLTDATKHYEYQADN